MYRVKRHIIEEPNPENSNFTLVKTDASDKGFTVPEIKSTVLPKAFEKPAAERVCFVHFNFVLLFSSF